MDTHMVYRDTMLLVTHSLWGRTQGLQGHEHGLQGHMVYGDTVYRDTYMVYGETQGLWTHTCFTWTQGL